MKVARLILGIISIVITPIIFFQSFAAGVVEAIDSNTESTASATGVIVGILLIGTGITAICTRKNVPGGFVCGGLYALAGLIALVAHGIYTDLIIWGSISLILSVFFIISGIVMAVQNKKKKNEAK